MNATPWHRDRDLPLHYYLMLSRTPGARVLLVPAPNGWVLPHFSPAITDFRRVRHLNDHVQEQYGLASVVQRCVAHRYDPDRGLQYRVYALENRSSALPLPDGVRWVGREELERVQLAMPEHRELIRHWLQDIATGTVPHLRAPWASAGWFDEASEWIQTQLEQLHIKMLGPMVQERAWSLSCIIRMETSIGDVYFKAVPPFMVQEAVAMREVSRRYPALLPAPLATDAGRGWMLMPDFGGDLLIHTPDVNRWEEALRMCAQMQVEQVGDVDDWLSRGIPDRRLHRMVQLTDPLIAMSTQILSGSPPGLSEEEVEGLHGLSLKMKLLCANLAGYGIPQTLVHGDLGGNILVNGDRYIVFDWTDVCISHPFFEMATMMDTVYDGSALQHRHETDVRARLRDAYLEPWTTFETMERLVEAFELTKSLGALHQAMSYMWILMNVAEDARWELESGLAMWLRSLLPIPPPRS
jgi:hypothetical protein